MDKRLIWPFRWLTRNVLSGIPIGREDAERLQKIGTTSVIIYVHQSRSVVHHLALSQSLKRANLQPPWKVMGIASGFLASWWSLFAPGRTKPKPQEIISELNHAIPVGLFLKHPKTLFSNPNKDTFDYLRSIIEMRLDVKRPIKLIPMLFVPRVNPERNLDSPAQLIFGTNREPGFLRALVRFATASASARWEVGDAIDVNEAVDTAAPEQKYELSDSIRKDLNKQLARLEAQYCGPSLKSAARMAEETLQEPALVRYIDRMSQQTGVLREKNHRRAQKYLKEIAAKFDIDAVRFLEKTVNMLKKRLYSGLEWEAKDIEKIRKAARKGPLVFVPSHRSHMDYLLLSYVLYQEGIMPPFIAAGDNLSFFPMGSIFRRGGAYFIRRSFKGDPLYPQVVKSYISRLFKDGYGQEFFIEGTRSRSGKTLWPKFGLLSIMADALSEPEAPNAQFIPASISYEKLLEGGAYEHELQGGVKIKESNKELLKSSKVLKKKYGKVYVSFDEPISFQEFLQKRDSTLEEINRDSTKLHEIAMSLGYHIAFGISRSFVISPTALIVTALFGAHRRMLSEEDLHRSIERILKHLRKMSGDSIRISSDLFDETSPAYKRSLKMLVDDRSVVAERLGKKTFYRVDDKEALKLDFFKNTLIHHFVPESILATAFVSLTGKSHKSVTKSALFENAKILSDIFRFEFIYPPGADFSDTFEHYFSFAVDNEILVVHGENLSIGSSSKASDDLQFASRMLANFVDAYDFSINNLDSILSDKLSKKDLIDKIIASLREAFLSGQVEHPESSNKAMANGIVQYLIYRQAIGSPDGKGKHFQLNHKVSLEIERDTLRRAHLNRILN